MEGDADAGEHRGAVGIGVGKIAQTRVLGLNGQSQTRRGPCLEDTARVEAQTDE